MGQKKQQSGNHVTHTHTHTSVVNIISAAHQSKDAMTLLMNITHTPCSACVLKAPPRPPSRLHDISCALAPQLSKCATYMSSNHSQRPHETSCAARRRRISINVSRSSGAHVVTAYRKCKKKNIRCITFKIYLFTQIKPYHIVLRGKVSMQHIRKPFTALDFSPYFVMLHFYAKIDNIRLDD